MCNVLNFKSKQLTLMPWQWLFKLSISLFPKKNLKSKQLYNIFTLFKLEISVFQYRDFRLREKREWQWESERLRESRPTRYGLGLRPPMKERTMVRGRDSEMVALAAMRTCRVRCLFRPPVTPLGEAKPSLQ